MNYAIYKTILGYIVLGYENDVLYSLQIKQEYPNLLNNKNNFTTEIMHQLDEYLAGKREKFDFKYQITGTAFQCEVYQKLCNIPYGETKSYQDIAIAIGNKKAARAVGMANNRNSLAIVVPCHRVIGKNADLVGYAAGLNIKKYLLDLEKCNKKDRTF